MPRFVRLGPVVVDLDRLVGWERISCISDQDPESKLIRQYYMLLHLDGCPPVPVKGDASEVFLKRVAPTFSVEDARSWPKPSPQTAVSTEEDPASDSAQANFS